MAIEHFLYRAEVNIGACFRTYSTNGNYFGILNVPKSSRLLCASDKLFRCCAQKINSNSIDTHLICINKSKENAVALLLTGCLSFDRQTLSAMSALCYFGSNVID